MNDFTRTHPMKGYRMLRHRLLTPVMHAALALVVLSCTDSTGPESRSSGQLRLLHAVPGAPTLAVTDTSFYAVKGKATSVEIWYHAKPGQTDSLKFIEFRVGASSLERRPDGSAIAQGDSVQITITATDASHMMIDFQPSGLRFSPDDPPVLRMFWGACGEDLNYDGVVDAYDVSIAQQISIWRQEDTSKPWFKLSSAVAPALKEVDAQLSGFTGYAISY